MNRLPHILSLVLLLAIPNLHGNSVHGPSKVWHRVSIDFAGPETSEIAETNPFTDYRLDVEFTGPSGQIFKVPGFYAADGDAAESSAEAGNIWRVNFCPDEAGTWKYKAFFVTGPYIASELEGGESAGFFDGKSGKFKIKPHTATNTRDFRNRGKLVYDNSHYLKFLGDETHFIKGGANSPEVLLEYEGFDNTPDRGAWDAHIQHWQTGDPTWQGDKGKGIIGVVNYLSDLGLNSYYFLTMNSFGDGKGAWPWREHNSLVRYDCSKLDQWDILFNHMTRKGMMIHFVLTETENEALFEIEETGDREGFAKSRKIYFREMVARFGYHPAVTWNIGEESGWDEGEGYHLPNSDEQREQFCDYMRALTYYDDNISVHNGPSWDDRIYYSLTGHKSHTGPALQWDSSNDIYRFVLKWRQRSIKAKHPWVVSLDEAYTSPLTQPLDDWRRLNVWPTYMAGGAGVEFYLGKGYDVRQVDFADYEAHYNTMAKAVSFFDAHVPYWKMEPLVDFADHAWTLAGEGHYLLYLKDGGTTNVTLEEGEYDIRWYNPRDGGNLQKGSVLRIQGQTLAPIGLPPVDPDQDWACLISRILP